MPERVGGLHTGRCCFLGKNAASRALGKIVRWVRSVTAPPWYPTKAHQAELGVQYMIYRQRIWNVQRANEGWRMMADCGTATANHMDHVQVTTYGNAAKGN